MGIMGMTDLKISEKLVMEVPVTKNDKSRSV